MQPGKIISTRRSAIPLDALQFKQVYDTRPELHQALVTAENGQYWLVKVKQTIFYFNSISHDPDRNLPVTTIDRVTRVAQ
ncbi:MAG: hypothetical protein V4717_21120 [Bacteroidota bacterium]